MQHKTWIYDNYLHITQRMRFDSLGLLFLSSIYLGSYRCLNMGNFNIFKERNPPKLVLLKALTRGPII